MHHGDADFSLDFTILVCSTTRAMTRTLEVAAKLVAAAVVVVVVVAIGLVVVVVVVVAVAAVAVAVAMAVVVGSNDATIL